MLPGFTLYHKVSQALKHRAERLARITSVVQEAKHRRYPAARPLTRASPPAGLPAADQRGFARIAGSVVGLTRRDEFGEFFPARHGGVLHEDLLASNLQI